MNDMPHPKFIISEGELIIGRAWFHKELRYHEEHAVLGGGWWYFDLSSKTMLLYGESSDFGPVTLADIKTATKLRGNSKHIERFVFSKAFDLNNAKIDLAIVNEVTADQCISDRTCLPSQYLEVINIPYFPGKGDLSIKKLEDLCEQFKEYTHQQAIIKQNLIKHINNNY